jgi:plasmid stabilization system protein ParE
MNRYTVLGRARQHLFDIWEYTAKTRGLDAADRMRDRIEAAFTKLGDSPGIGHWREDLLDRRYRFWLVHPFLIAYSCVHRILTSSMSLIPSSIRFASMSLRNLTPSV